MGDPALADEALIPPAVGLSDPDYILGHGHLDYAAEAQLINDNLLDFSHLSYVHANSFGAGPEFAESLPKLEPLERGVRFSRWMVDTHGQSTRKSAGPDRQLHDLRFPDPRRAADVERAIPERHRQEARFRATAARGRATTASPSPARR